jgi:hypothetical protein
MAKLVRLDDGTPAIALSETEFAAFAESPRELEPAATRHGGDSEQRTRLRQTPASDRFDSGGTLRAVREVVGTAAGATAVAYVAGAALVVTRLEARDLPAIAVIGTVPREAILAVGASQALAPAIVVMAAHAFWSTIEHDALSDLRRRWSRDQQQRRGPVERFVNGSRTVVRRLQSHPNRFGDPLYQVIAVGLWLVLLGVISVVAAIADAPALSERLMGWVLGLVLLALIASAATVRWLTVSQRSEASRRVSWFPRTLAYGSVVLVFSIMLFANARFASAQACTNGGPVVGVLVGQGADRVLLGTTPTGASSLIISLPASDVSELVVGPHAREARCPV